MAKKLQLQFYNADNKTVTISLDDPIEPADSATISQAMDDIIAQNALQSSGGDLVAKKGARIVDRNVQEIPLV